MRGWPGAAGHGTALGGRARRDERLAVRVLLPLGLPLPLRELLGRHELPITELNRPLERHAQLVVGRKESRDIRIAPGRFRSGPRFGGRLAGKGRDGAEQQDGRDKKPAWGPPLEESLK